jgi:hypothetical protein
MPANSDIVRIQNVRRFDQVVSRVTYRMEQSPSRIFQEMMPGSIMRYTEDIGPWEGRGDEHWEVPTTAQDAHAVSRSERADRGEYDMHHIVAKRGVDMAGRTQRVDQEDFDYGGMPQEKVVELSARPRRDWNKTAAETILDVLTQGAFGRTDDTPQEAFQPSVTDFNGNTINFPQATEDSDFVADVVAHSGQNVNWPLRDGSTTGTGHDHVSNAAGGSWTLSLGRTARDHIREHPGNGRVYALCGANVAADVRSKAKTEYGAVESRTEFITTGDEDAGAFADIAPLATLESVDYFHMPDMPDDIAVYLASNKQPVYASPGAVSAEGRQLANGDWTENIEQTTGGELSGLKWGYRRWFDAGVQDPTALFVQEVTA